MERVVQPWETGDVLVVVKVRVMLVIKRVSKHRPGQVVSELMRQIDYNVYR